MIQCPSCSNLYEASLGACLFCGHSPKIENGIILWSPELASMSKGFKSEYFSTLAKLEENNFWFQARNELILWVLEYYFRGFDSFMEIGCGTGFVLQDVAKKYPSSRLSGSEIFTAGLEFAKSRAPHSRLVQMDATKIPYRDEFDVIGIFDVLEHIEDDNVVIAGMFKALRPEGGLIVTVPQHPRLWSSSDEYACHVRRYTSAEIISKLKLAGFQIIRSTSFVSLLLPALIVSRLNNVKSRNYDPLSEFNISSVLNRILRKIMKIELTMIQSGVSFPAGGSRLVIARKVKK